VYVVKLELYWGFNNATLMEDYETYTLTCTTDGDGSQNLAAKNIDDRYVIPIGYSASGRASDCCLTPSEQFSGLHYRENVMFR